MQNAFRVAVAVLLAGGLAFAQAGTGNGDSKARPKEASPRDPASGAHLKGDASKNGANTSKAHKGGKKGKKVADQSGKRQHNPL